MNCCDENTAALDKQYETVLIEKTKNVCPLCEDYSKEHSSKPVAVLSCEGACLRGEISRQAANKICFDLAGEKTVRICLGGALQKIQGKETWLRMHKK